MKIELEINANKNCDDIVLSAKIDNLCVLETSATVAAQSILINVPESQTDHVLSLTMSGKNRSHTKIDHEGNIYDDIYFTVGKLTFEDLDMRQFFCSGKLCYNHSFNTDRPCVMDEFHGLLGCNGTVNFEFRQPFFLWLYDHTDIR